MRLRIAHCGLRIGGAGVAAGLLLAGCAVLPWKVATKPVEAQKGGVASGSGGTIWQPVNSAAPSTQQSEREVWFQPEAAEPGALPVIAVVAESGVKPDDGLRASRPDPHPAGAVVWPPPRPAYVREKTTTTLGAHQDLAGIMEAASSLLKQTSTLLWFGIMAAVGGAFAIAWSWNNEQGYMVVSAVTMAVGVTWLVVPSQSSWWLLLAVVPVGLWLRQQAGFMRLVGFP